MKDNYFTYFALTTALFVAGCSGNINPEEQKSSALKHQSHGDYQVSHLPLSTQWRMFRCREGNLNARYTNSSQKNLTIRLDKGSEFTLSRRPSYNPAIFENGRVAFYINEKEAVLGQPNSPRVMMTGCQPQ